MEQSPLIQRLRLTAVTLALVLACLLAALITLSAPRAANALIDSAATGDSAAASDADGVLPSGSTVAHGRWEVTVGAVSWHQNKAVEAATFIPSPLIESAQWVLAPVNVHNRGGDVASVSGIHVRLLTGSNEYGNGISHTAHHKAYPRQTLPDELDGLDMEPGESREGNVGWAVDNSAADAPCVLVVEISTPEDTVPFTRRIACE